MNKIFCTIKYEIIIMNIPKANDIHLNKGLKFNLVTMFANTTHAFIGVFCMLFSSGFDDYSWTPYDFQIVYIKKNDVKILPYLAGQIRGSILAFWFIAILSLCFESFPTK